MDILLIASLVLLGLMAIVVAVAAGLLRGARTQAAAGEAAPAMPYKRRRGILSKNEAAFFHALKRAIGDRYVAFAQLPLSVLIYCDREARKGGWHNKIDRKRVDFVLCDAQTLGVVCVIELDDKSHQRRDRQQRDAFVNEALSAAGIRLARIPAASEYPIDRVQQHLQPFLS